MVPFALVTVLLRRPLADIAPPATPVGLGRPWPGALASRVNVGGGGRLGEETRRPAPAPPAAAPTDVPSRIGLARLRPFLGAYTGRGAARPVAFYWP